MRKILLKYSIPSFKIGNKKLEVQEVEGSVLRN